MTTFNRETTGREVVAQYGDVIKGKTVLITGASENGLGAETAISLAHAGPKTMLLLARSAAKVDPVVTRIKEIDPSIDAVFIPIDLSDFDSVRSAAARINSTIQQLDLMINNAGIMAVKDYTTNKNGIEMQFATNHLGHFLLTALVFSKILAAGKGTRIVNLTSDGHTICPFMHENYNFDDGADYDCWSGYGQAKTANILFTRQLATKLANRGILSYAVHPGVIISTSLGSHLDKSVDFGDLNPTAVRRTGQPFVVGQFKSAQEGVATTLVAALDPRIEKDSGAYMADCATQETRDYATSLENAQSLWDLSERLVGEKFDL